MPADNACGGESGRSLSRMSVHSQHEAGECHCWGRVATLSRYRPFNAKAGRPKGLWGLFTEKPTSISTVAISCSTTSSQWQGRIQKGSKNMMSRNHTLNTQVVPLPSHSSLRRPPPSLHRPPQNTAFIVNYYDRLTCLFSPLNSSVC